jgi:hypothetical protein
VTLVGFSTAKENLMKTLTFLKPADDRLTAEQPRAILKVLEAKFGPDVAVTFEDLGAALKDEPTFVSRQKPELVVAYYARRLSDKGYCKYEITETTEEPPVEVIVEANEIQLISPKPKGRKAK